MQVEEYELFILDRRPSHRNKAIKSIPLKHVLYKIVSKKEWFKEAMAN